MVQTPSGTFGVAASVAFGVAFTNSRNSLLRNLSRAISRSFLSHVSSKVLRQSIILGCFDLVEFAILKFVSCLGAGDSAILIFCLDFLLFVHILSRESSGTLVNNCVSACEGCREDSCRGDSEIYSHWPTLESIQC